MSRTINRNYKRKNFNKKFTSSKGDAIASNYFRRQLNEWRQASLEEHNRRCVISGETENLDIHHINVRFKDILKEAHENLNKEVSEHFLEYVLFGHALFSNDQLLFENVKRYEDFYSNINAIVEATTKEIKGE